MSQQKVCKNCRYWRRGAQLKHQRGLFGDNPPIAREVVGKTKRGSIVVCVCDDTNTMGLCLHLAMGSDYTDGWLNRKETEERTTGVYASGDSRGHLAIGQHFGCIHFARQ